MKYTRQTVVIFCMFLSLLSNAQISDKIKINKSNCIDPAVK